MTHILLAIHFQDQIASSSPIRSPGQIQNIDWGTWDILADVKQSSDSVYTISHDGKNWGEVYCLHYPENYRRGSNKYFCQDLQAEHMNMRVID
jgi:hypothetical protein